MSESAAVFADVVVVGGGSCGSVVAARLSEDPACSVIVLEAGPSFLGSSFPPDVLDARVLPIGPESPWIGTYPAELTPTTPRVVARGQLVGGSGAVNGAYFVRARPSDFHAWPPSWSFETVLPYFRSMENDADFGGDFHGDCGPMPVARVHTEKRARITEMFDDAAVAAGFPEDPDKNDPSSVGGVGPLPCNISHGVRVNSALAYLVPALHRPNLTVLDRTTVLAVTFDGMRATGVTIVHDGVVSRIGAGRVVLCGGAVRTPALMMLSGIGSAKHLADLNISVVLDQPNVGHGFSDHPEIGVHYRMPIDDTRTSPLESVLHFGDLEIRPYTAAFSRLIPGLPVGDPMIGVGLMRSDSRGDITLRSANPLAAPLVRYRYLESASDRAALEAGLDLVDDVLGPRLTRTAVGGDRVLGSLGTSLHLSGSCAMGEESNSVLDDACRVRGVDGLDVVDTSAFPVVPTRGPHATAIMLAERASELIRTRVA